MEGSTTATKKMGMKTCLWLLGQRVNREDHYYQTIPNRERDNTVIKYATCYG